MHITLLIINLLVHLLEVRKKQLHNNEKQDFNHN